MWEGGRPLLGGSSPASDVSLARISLPCSCRCIHTPGVASQKSSCSWSEARKYRVVSAGPGSVVEGSQSTLPGPFLPLRGREKSGFVDRHVRAHLCLHAAFSSSCEEPRVVRGPLLMTSSVRCTGARCDGWSWAVFRSSVLTRESGSQVLKTGCQHRRLSDQT